MMSPELVIAVLSALGLGSALPWIGRRMLRDPKGQAEARKLNEESDDLIVTRLYAEIERIDRSLGDVRSELAEVKETAADEKTALERENKRLRAEVGRLTRRVEGLESLLRVQPLSAADRALLEELDRKTNGRNG